MFSDRVQIVKGRGVVSRHLTKKTLGLSCLGLGNYSSRVGDERWSAHRYSVFIFFGFPWVAIQGIAGFYQLLIFPVLPVFTSTATQLRLFPSEISFSCFPFGRAVSPNTLHHHFPIFHTHQSPRKLHSCMFGDVV